MVVSLKQESKVQFDKSVSFLGLLIKHGSVATYKNEGNPKIALQKKSIATAWITLFYSSTDGVLPFIQSSTLYIL